MLVTAYIRIAQYDGETARDSGVSAGPIVRPERRVKRPIQSAAAHDLLNAMLEREHVNASSLRLVHSSDGRPLLYCNEKLSPIAVSTSHSRAIAACAISDLGTIGIDVEFRTDRPFEAIAATAFGPQEQRIVAREGIGAFYRIWTLREALAKATIGGIERLTDGRDYFAATTSAGIWHCTIDSQRWVFWNGVVAEDYAIAVAIAPLASLEITPVVSMTIQSFAFYDPRLT